MSGFSFQIYSGSEYQQIIEFIVHKCWYDTRLIRKMDWKPISLLICGTLKYRKYLES